MKSIQCWRLKVETASEANSSEHWTVKNRRHKQQKRKVKEAFLEDKPQITIPCHVVLTRIAPRQLDSDDNLPMSLKYIKDYVAAELTGDYRPGRADGDKRLTWEYKQEKGAVREYGVRIELIKET